MISRIRSWLKGFGSSQSQPLEQARSRRHEALCALRQAEDRGDCREIGRWRMELAQRTHAELAEQVWR